MPFDVKIKDRQECVIWTHLNRETIRWMAEQLPNAYLPPKVREDIEFAIQVESEYADQDDLLYVNRARDEIMDYGHVEIDDNAMVSKGAEYGAYVMAWVFVYNQEDEDDFEDHE